MNKLYFLILIFFTFLTTCDNAEQIVVTTLTINNMSSYNIFNVEYGSFEFGSINNGKEKTKEVTSGSRYVTFYLYDDIEETRCRINQVLTCEESKNNEITIINNTLITRFSNNYSDTLKNIHDNIPIFYKIGDIGPSGGFIFFNSGGQYKECSDDLGINNWSTANINSLSYRGGNFNNWSLPTRSELELIYNNLYKKGVGSFINDNYWTIDFSRELIGMNIGSRNLYFSTNFANGNWSERNESWLIRFCYVRSFSNN